MVGDTEFLKRAIAAAHPNALRLALYQLTGRSAFTNMKLVKQPIWGGTYEQLTLAPEDLTRLRDMALEILSAEPFESGGDPDKTRAAELIKVFLGGADPDKFIVDMGWEELSFEPFPRGVTWEREPATELKNKFHVLVVGAGAAGLTAGVQLGQLGVPYTIIERNAGVGGTWWTNDYPDARVDTASHIYQLSYMRNYPWRHYYAVQPELQHYFERVATDYDVKRHIRFNSEIVSAEWNEAESAWHVVVRDNQGRESRLTAQAIISAAGVFNQPNVPNIPGIDTFRGRIFHTTAWDHSYDYAGKCVSLIGVGSTGAQLMPALARRAASVTAFQRSPQWVGPRDGYRDPVSREVQWLFDNIPYYWNWFCFANFHSTSDVRFLQICDREWQSSGGLISKRNDSLRAHLRDYVMRKVGHVPELASRLVPNFPPFAKRLIADNGWYDALLQDHVELVTDSIAEITPLGIKTVDGRVRPADLIVLAGGFKTERYLWPVTYRGRGGISLEEAWSKDGARAYLGLTVPDFPNLFIIYGPNAQARSGGVMQWLEIWVRYSVKAITLMIERNIKSIDCRPEVFARYNEALDVALKDSIWDESGARSYYINAHGRQSTNMPWEPCDYYEWTKSPNLEDFRIA